MKLVLLAEDEEALLETFADVIVDMGHKVLTADNGQDALSLARAHRPDLIVSDHMMPRLTGVELLRAVRSDADLSRIPFIIVSAAYPRGVEEADQYLAKPIGLDQFERAVKAGLEKSPPRPASVTTELTQGQESALSLAREEMLNWVAHELRTPLSAAKMNAELIQRHLVAAGDPAHRQRGEVVLRQLARMDALVTSILEAARLSDGRIILQKETHDMVGFLQAIVSDWRKTQPEFELAFEPPVEALPLRFDAERLRQVVDNLISNAVKYGLPCKRVEVALVLAPATAEVRVKDFGPGIDAADLPRIFGRFYRARNAAGSGHGLGLYIAAALARLHGGALRVDSRRGEGSTFTLVLPRS